MTLHRASPRVLTAVLLALLASLGLACVLADAGVGDSCEGTFDCLSPNVCVRLDEADPEGGSVCMPMLELPSPQACVVDDDCPLAGWPVDASCDDEGRCLCAGSDFACDGGDEVVGEHTCRCLVIAFLGDPCEDDNQCEVLICGSGVCTEGANGETCDSDADCPNSDGITCEAGFCI